MKKMRRWFSLALFAGLAFLLSGCGAQAISEQNILEKAQEENEIVWGVKYDTNLFGFYNIADSQVEGFDIDIAKAITAEILGEDAKASFVEVTSKTRIPLLKNGNIDGIIATMTITEERREQVDFSEVYFSAGQSLLVPNDSSIGGLQDLTADDTVLVVKGSTSADNIREAAPQVNVLELENYSECFTALQAGQGEVMSTDNAILLGLALENPSYQLVGGTFTDEPYGIAINKNQTEFLTAVDEAIEAMVADGTYQEIYTKWFQENEDGSIAKK